MITSNEYIIYEKAYNFFNEKLFGNNLPEVLITLNRKKGARGTFRFENIVDRNNPKNLISEISLNPDTFVDRNDIDLLSTLVHEQNHVWQFYLGNRPEKPKYHDKEFSEMMEKIGLMTSSTGEEGGKRCGVSMSHWIIPNGKFEKYCVEFLRDNKINWQNVPLIEKEKSKKERKSKLKYICPDCQKIAWQKEISALICGECHQEMEEEIL